MEIIPIETASNRNHDDLKYVKSKVPYEEFCPFCRTTITTTTKKTCGMLNFVLFIACLFFPCLVCVFWLPCFMDTQHRCPECKKALSKSDRI